MAVLDVQFHCETIQRSQDRASRETEIILLSDYDETNQRAFAIRPVPVPVGQIKALEKKKNPFMIHLEVPV